MRSVTLGQFRNRVVPLRGSSGPLCHPSSSALRAAAQNMQVWGSGVFESSIPRRARSWLGADAIWASRKATRTCFMGEALRAHTRSRTTRRCFPSSWSCEVPSDGQLAEALTHVGAEKVIIDGRRVFKADPFAQVDVGGAAKGYAADEIAVKLREAGVANADIDLGGNLFMLGEHPSGRPWRVSIQDPRYASPANAHAGLEKPPQAELPILEVTDQAVVTSGSYERFAEIDGVRYQHIVDLRTGQPSNSDVVSATVVSSSALRADMLATTALIVDPVDLQARHPGERFVIVV